MKSDDDQLTIAVKYGATRTLMKSTTALTRSSLTPLFATMNVLIALVVVSLMVSTVIPCRLPCDGKQCATFHNHSLHQYSCGASSQFHVLSHMQCTSFCTAHVLPLVIYVLSCWAVLSLRSTSLFLHPVPFVVKLALHLFFQRLSVHVSE